MLSTHQPALQLAPGAAERDNHAGMPYPERRRGNCRVTLTIDLPDELEAALLVEAHAQGVSADRFARRLLEGALTEQMTHPGQPFETGRGMLAKYGPAPTAEEIDANRADMFHGFAEDF
jgi:hypothetical protein